MNTTDPLRYQTGFSNEFATEALPGALPANQNSPQQCAYGLYAEQISGIVNGSQRNWFGEEGTSSN